MDTFSQAIAVVAAICLGIFAVTIFLTVLNFLKNLIGGASGQILAAQDSSKKIPRSRCTLVEEKRLKV